MQRTAITAAMASADMARPGITLASAIAVPASETSAAHTVKRRLVPQAPRATMIEWTDPNLPKCRMRKQQV